jgi:hypothetical protein
MRQVGQAVGVLLHLAHVGLLVCTALTDSRPRPSRRSDARYDVRELLAAPDSASHIAIVRGTGPVPPSCPMPVLVANSNVQYAAVLIEPAGVEGSVRRWVPPCANPYARLAAQQ